MYLPACKITPKFENVIFGFTHSNTNADFSTYRPIFQGKFHLHKSKFSNHKPCSATFLSCMNVYIDDISGSCNKKASKTFALYRRNVTSHLNDV